MIIDFSIKCLDKNKNKISGLAYRDEKGWAYSMLSARVNELRLLKPWRTLPGEELITTVQLLRFTKKGTKILETREVRALPTHVMKKTPAGRFCGWQQSTTGSEVSL